MNYIKNEMLKFIKKNKETKSSSGLKLSYYFDCFKILEDNQYLDYICNQIEKYFPCNLVGIESFGNIIIAYLKGKYSFRFIELYILKKRSHGIRKTIYGYIDIAYPLILFDDVITTGKTIEYAITEIQKKFFSTPEKILCIKNRSEMKNIQNIPIIEL